MALNPHHLSMTRSHASALDTCDAGALLEIADRELVGAQGADGGDEVAGLLGGVAARDDVLVEPERA